MSQNFDEIAKEITIAAIEKGLIVPPGKGQYKNLEEFLEYNQHRANEVGKFYKTVAKAVSEAMQGKFTNE